MTKLDNLRLILRRIFRKLTRTPRRKTAWVLLIAFLINQFVYPLLPFWKTDGVKANGTIEPVALGTSLFVNRNPEFNVWFGDRLDQTQHKTTFEIDGKEIEMRFQDLRSQILDVRDGTPSGELASISAQLSEIEQITQEIGASLQKPYLTTIERPDGLADAIEQHLSETTKIRYEILPDKGVKESILINDQGSRIDNQFVFSLKLSNGVQLKSKLENLSDTNLNASGSATTSSYYFTDSKNKYLANFEPLIMTDAAGSKSNDIALSITPLPPLKEISLSGSRGGGEAGGDIGCLMGSCYTVTLTANSDWLNSPDRVFPIDLDPTIVHDKNPDFSSGTENRSQVSGTGTVEGQYKELQPDINTVGLWHFNEGSGTTAHDASGNSKNGTLTNGPVWNGPTDTLVGLGKSNLSFDNADDYVVVGALTSAAVVKTVEFWVYPKSTSTEFIDLNGSAYINVASGTVTATGFTSPTIYINGNASTTLSANQWSHVTVTTETALNASATNFGKRSTSYLNGYLDEVRISNKARTPEEIAASASRFPYSVHESPVIDFGSTPNTLDSLNYSASGVQTGDGERPYSRDGLVAQWNFNETSGTTAYNMAGSDSCGGTPSSCNGTLTSFASTSSQDQAAGTGWTTNDRRWGAGALMFDGTNDYVIIADNSSITPTNAISFGAWIKPSKIGSAQKIIAKSNEGVSATYDLDLSAEGTILCRLQNVGSNIKTFSTSSKVNVGEWSHVFCTYDGSIAKIYINGQLSTSAYATGTLGGTTQLMIGAYLSSSSPTSYFSGVIDSVGLYSRALTATEILSNYQSGNIEFQTRTGATSTPNDGTWEAWKTTSDTGDTQIDAMDATTGWAWDSNTSDPTSVALDTTTKIEGTGSLKNIVGMPEADASTVALYHLEETSGTGAYIQDSSAINADGTPTGTTVVDGFYGKGRSFNGSSDFIDVGTGPTSVKSVEFWVNPVTTTEYFINTTSTSTYIWAGAGTVTATGFTSPTIYVDGAVSSTIVAGKWQHVAVTSATAVNASNLDIGRIADVNYLEGKIDEVRLLNSVLSADSVAEIYRAGRDHRISKTISSTDLSSKTKLPFYIASDRPGTFLEATVGESAYANYETDANTVGLWHLEEDLGSADTTAFLKDSSGNGANMDPGTTTAYPAFVQGKLGKARYFDGGDSASATVSNPVYVNTLDLWIKPTSSVASKTIATNLTTNASSQPVYGTCTGTALTLDVWTHITATSTSSAICALYQNGVLTASNTTGVTFGTTLNAGATSFIGTIDEVRLSNIVRTPDQIRQAFEIGKRTHPITIDFKADLDSSNLITNTSDLSFAIQPDTDVPSTSLSINKGEKIIVKENYNGTEYLAQGTVTGVTYESNTSNPNAWSQDASSQSSSTTVTVTAWDSGSTVPSGGFTTAATVFKWQREYMDLTQMSFASHRDAVTRLSLRVIDGSQGANIWLDDFESADYSDGSRVTIGSTVNRYFQYRAILSTLPLSSSPALTNVTINYNSGTTAQAPKVKDASSDFSATGTSLNRITDTGSSNSPSLELAYKELPKDINTRALYHFNSGVCATDSSGNAYTLTANGGMTCATGGKFGYTASGFATTPVSYSHATILDTALTSGTIEAWINPANLSAVQTILYADSTNDTLLTLGTSGQINFSTSGSTNLATANSLVAASGWYHIAGVWTSAGHKIYINGVEIASDTNITTHTSQDYTTYIGVGSGGNTLPFSSLIDEVRISNIARTPEEIKYDAGRRPYGVYTSDVQNLGTKVSSIDNIRWTENGVQTGDGETPYSSTALTAQWNFNETSGTTAVSGGSCGSTCNGTVTNMTTTSQDVAAGDGWTANNRKWGSGALMFDGTDGHVTIPNSNTVSSVEMWINPPSVTSINIMQLTATATVTTSATGLITAGAGFTTPTIYLNGSTTDLILKAGQWNHVVVSSATGISTSTGYLGRVSTSYFKGVMDAVRLYNRTLSAVEVLANYQAGNIELQTRTSADNATWEAWKPTISETAIDSMDGPYQYNTTDTGFVAYWPMDETTDNSCTGGTNDVCDKKGSLDGAATGTVITTNSKFGRARYFDGSDDKIALGTTGIPSGNSAYAMEAWIKPTSLGTYGIIGWGNWGTPSQVNAFRLTSDGLSHYWWGNDLTITASTLADGGWHYVLAQFNGTTRSIWVDGVQYGSDTPSNHNAIVTDVNIGRTNSTEYFPGTIDEVRVYSSALSTSTILDHYNEGMERLGLTSSFSTSTDTTIKSEGTASQRLNLGAPVVDGNTVALWHMDETSGTGAYIKDDIDRSSFSATGGTITSSGLYTIHTFTSDGTFTPNGVGNTEYLVVGGGAGGGSSRAGGGGAGGLKTGSIAVTAQAYSITVGGGGNGGTLGASGSNGTDSIFSSITATGGGKGQGANGTVGNGGSGGGSVDAGTVGTGIAGQGNDGGGSVASGGRGAGGGGGANAVGVTGTTTTGGNGGTGTTSSISGASVTYSGGGGGGCWITGGCTSAGSGGTGGGGAGTTNATTATAGTANTGGGGGGGGYEFGIGDGGNGGSGIVIIRYITAHPGTPIGTTSVDGFYGKARNFNGSSDYISAGSVNASVKSVDFWVYPNSTTTEFIDLNGSAYINASAGTIAATGFTSPTIYVNGVVSSTIVANQWQHVAVTTGTTINASAVNIGKRSTSYFSGKIDEVRISNVVRTADEIAEAYRAGRDHRVSKVLNSNDLSSKTKLPFYVASDRPGTFLEATVGESAYANYETDANTVGLWHLEEDLGSADTTAFLKDSSGNGANMDPGTTTAYPAFVQGKLGKARYFDGGDSASATVSNPVYVNTLDLWIKPTSSVASKTIATNLTTNASSQPVYGTCTGTALTLDVWTHITATSTSSAICALYQNGVLTASNTTGVTFGTTLNAGATSFIGTIDEVRLSNIARTPDEIRQAFEIGKRTHQITNDFVTTPQAAYSSGTSVTINNPYGTTNLTDTLSIGDTMIFKENVGGTETVSQAVVTNIVNTSGVYGTVTLLAAPSFPSGGYTTNATVFKWQKEFVDITSSFASHRDAVTRLSLRVIDGSQGANIWIDDIKAAGPYLTQSTTRTASVTSTPRQFMQYRIIFSTTDPLVSPTVTSVSVQTHSSPVKVVGSDTLGADGSFDKDGNLHLGSNNVKKVAFYDRTKDQISYGLDFDNSNDYVAVGTGPTSVKTVEFWVNPNSTSTEFIDLNGSAYINVSSGTIGTTGFTSPTVYVDGAVSSTVVANKWQHIAVTTGTGLNATALNFGKRSTSYFNGLMDEVALYSSVLTAAQVTTDYNIRRLAGTETGLVALYHFDEGQGTRAYDSVGGFHGTLTNMAATAWVNSQNDRDQSALSVQTLGIDPNWANGPTRENNALKFDDSDDYVTISDHASLDLATNGTIEAWVKFKDPEDNNWIVCKASNYCLGLNSTGAVLFTGASAQNNGGTSVISGGLWYHLAVTNDNTTVAYYVNGVQAGTDAVAWGSTLTNALEFGRDGGINYFDGVIDEVAIFNTVRTAAEISADYNNRRFKGNETGLQGLWHLDEGVDNTCSGGTNDSCDASSNTNDGANTNSPTWVTNANAIMDNNARYISLNSQSSNPNDKGMEIYGISTTQFKYRWTGDQTWSSAVNFSSYPFAIPAQLGTTGVYVGFDTTNGVFGDESYFLIPSWAIQQFSSTRGIRRSFPERSYLVATDRGFDIIDADDNTLWMRSTNGTGTALGVFTNNTPSSITMAHGQLFVGTNGTAATGLYRFDFNQDKIYRYNNTNRTLNTQNIAKRNTADSTYSLDAFAHHNQLSSVINDVSVLLIGGRLFMATAQSIGMTKIANIMLSDALYSPNASLDYNDVSGDSYGRIKIIENYLSGTGAVGDMYALNTTPGRNALERWDNTVNDIFSKTSGTPELRLISTTTPALFASAQTVNDLDIKTGTSLASANNSTIYVGHDAGVTVVQENRATQASSSVKYYTKDYIGEEMVGDIRGNWPLQDVNDYSLKGNTLTNNGTVTFTTSGVRGKTASFNGSNYLSCTDAACGGTSKLDTTGTTISIGAWIKPSTISGSDQYIIAKFNETVDGSYGLIYNYIGQAVGRIQRTSNLDVCWATGATTVSGARWHFLVTTYDGTNCNIYVDGVLDGYSPKTFNIHDSTSGFTIGAELSGGSPASYFGGLINSAFVTATALTAIQVKQMYVAGVEALNNKYRVKLASDTVNQLAGSINVVKGVAASDNYIFAGTNTTGADDGILSRVLLRGDVTDKTYDESTTDPLIVDNDINSVAVSKDGAYIIVGTDDQGITIIHNGAAANRLRVGSKVQGPYKRPSN